MRVAGSVVNLSSRPDQVEYFRPLPNESPVDAVKGPEPVPGGRIRRRVSPSEPQVGWNPRAGARFSPENYQLGNQPGAPPGHIIEFKA